MPTISLEDVAKIAALARLGLTDAELKRTAADLEKILANFAAIQKLNTDQAALSDDVSGKTNVSREDVVDSQALCDSGKLMSLAPDVAEEQFKVKAVFK